MTLPAPFLADQRIFIWVQHLLGTGHLRRMVRLAHGMARAGAKVVVATGGAPLHIESGPARIEQLPPVRCNLGDFKVLRHLDGTQVDEAFKQQRRDQLLALLAEVQPTALILEHFPFGRRQMRFELLPLLDWVAAQSPRPKVVASVRDILVQNHNPDRLAWTVNTLRAHFDGVLVHGDPQFLPLEASFPAATELTDMLAYTGYVSLNEGTPAALSASPTRHGDVVVSVGGGIMAEDLIPVALKAAALDHQAHQTLLTEGTGRHWRFLVAPTDPNFAAYQDAAPPNATVEPTRPDFLDILATAGVSISQCGYNTAIEAVMARVPSVFIPFETPEETEQRQRAEALAEAGYADFIPAASVTPEGLLDAVAAARWSPRRSFDVQGVAGSVAAMAQLLARED